MPVVSYPTTLPNPSVSSVAPAERRLLSDVTGGPQQARGVQRDYLGTQGVEWSLLSATDAASLDLWWRTTLTYGGAWFASTWPAPQGWVSAVRRIVGAPQWAHLPGGFWKVTATVQVRGVGMAPTNCVTENFGAGLGGYATITGNAALFTIVGSPYGNAINIASQNSATEARIRRTFFDQNVTTLSAKFMLTAINADDGGRLSVFVSGTAVLVFDPVREAAYDSLRRAYLYIGADAPNVTDAALTVNDWYQIDLALSAVAGASTCVITHLADGVIVKSVSLASAHPPPAANSLDFSADSAGTTSPVQYTDIHIC